MISREGVLPTLFIATIDTLTSELVAIIVKVFFWIVFFFVLSQSKFRVRLYETPPKEASGGGFYKDTWVFSLSLLYTFSLKSTVNYVFFPQYLSRNIHSIWVRFSVFHHAFLFSVSHPAVEFLKNSQWHVYLLSTDYSQQPLTCLRFQQLALHKLTWH